MKCICFNRILKTFILFEIIFFKQNVRVSCTSRNDIEQQEYPQNHHQQQLQQHQAIEHKQQQNQNHYNYHQEPLQEEYDNSAIDDNIDIHDIATTADDDNNNIDNDDDEENDDIQIANILGRRRTRHTIHSDQWTKPSEYNDDDDGISNNDYNDGKNIDGSNTKNDNAFLLSSIMKRDISDGNSRNNGDHNDDDDDDIGFNNGDGGDGDGIDDKNSISGYKMYTELDKLNNFVQNKVRRSSEIMVNDILDKNSNLLNEHFKKKIQSAKQRKSFKKNAQITYKNQQQDGISYLKPTPSPEPSSLSSPAVDTASMRMEKVLNVLTPYYGNIVAVHHNKLTDLNKQKYKNHKIKEQINKEINIISNKNDDNDVDFNENDDGNDTSDGDNETLDNDEELLKILSQLQTIHQDKDYAEIYDQACEICSPGIHNKHCCSMNEITKSKRQISPSLSLSPSSLSSLQSDSTKPFMNSNPSSIYPGVVVKTSPNLSTYNKLISNEDNGGGGVIGVNNITNSNNTSLINNSQIGTNSNSLSSYADFLNYYEQQQQQQQQQIQQPPPKFNLAARDNNNTINTQLSTAQLPPTQLPLPLPPTAVVTEATFNSNNGDGNNVRKSATDGATSNTTITTTAQSIQNNTYQQQGTLSPSTISQSSQSNNITIEQQQQQQQQQPSEQKQQQQPFNNVTTIGYNNDCPKYMDVANATAVLERVLEELELIRQAKEGNMTPEGAPCEILGSWNSEIIGLRFDINVSSAGVIAATEHSNLSGAHDLSIKLFDHNPPKRNTLMDTRSWTCTGQTIHGLHGGPFYITAVENKENVLAIFTGLCKTCGGVDTIFGTWSIVHHAKDCRDLQMSIETKRDIFRKEMLYIKKNKKLEKIKMNNNNNANNGNDNNNIVTTETSISSSDKQQTEKQITTTTILPQLPSKSSSLPSNIGGNGKTLHEARNYYYY